MIKKIIFLTVIFSAVASFSVFAKADPVFCKSYIGVIVYSDASEYYPNEYDDNEIISELGTIMLLIMVSFFIGFAFLQINFSKEKSKYSGLVIPVFSLLISFVFCSMDGAEKISDRILNFLIVNIPTIMFIVIYFICRIIVAKK